MSSIHESLKKAEGMPQYQKGLIDNALKHFDTWGYECRMACIAGYLLCLVNESAKGGDDE